MSVNIPIVDISGLYVGSDAARKKVIDDFRQAARDHGFMQIIGHNVPRSTTDALLRQSAHFFNLDLQTKMQCRGQGGDNDNRGYERLGLQTLEQFDEERRCPDQKEGFTIRRDILHATRRFQGVNVWPPEALAPGFRITLEGYYEAMRALSLQLMRILCLALELEETTFDRHGRDEDAINNLRIMRYPPVTHPTEAQGAGAHTDFGMLTVLLQDDVGGLQVRESQTGRWLDVKSVADAFVVNIGDLTERLTNGHFKSTIHRVAANVTSRDRYSCAYFNEGILDYVIDCVPVCKPKEGDATSRPAIRVEDYLEQRFHQSYRSPG